ncbi:MAG: radical SAM protein [bacterium]|nr:radical SAM protein [bacterium]
MKIVLLTPQSNRYGKNGAFDQRLRYAPLTMSTLAALIPQKLDVSVKCIDEWADDFDPYTIDADLVGITVITGNAPKAYRYSRILRDRGITVVLGGVHITLCPDEAEQHADAIVFGYAEEAWPDLLRDFATGLLKKRYDRQPTTLDGYPRPRRDLLKKEKYTTMNVVQATRGCVYRCTFCVVPSAWPKQYQRDPDDVAREASELSGKTFILIDLSPSSDQEYFGRLADAFAPLQKYWGGLATLDITDNQKLMKRLERSGCRGLLVGIESQNPKTLKAMGKSWQKPDDNLWRIRMLHDHGIAVNGCFVFGIDGDTERVFDETLEFVFKASIDLPRFAIATPFPNTPLYRMLDQEKRIINKNWEWYDGQHVVFRPKGITPECLYEGTKRTWKEAYKLTSIARRIATSAASLNPLVFVTSVGVNLGYNVYARKYPAYMPIPCEERSWFSAPEYAVAHQPLVLGEVNE